MFWAKNFLLFTLQEVNFLKAVLDRCDVYLLDTCLLMGVPHLLPAVHREDRADQGSQGPPEKTLAQIGDCRPESDSSNFTLVSISPKTSNSGSKFNHEISQNSILTILVKSFYDQFL